MISFRGFSRLLAAVFLLLPILAVAQPVAVEAAARWVPLVPGATRTGAAFDPTRHWMILPGPTTWILDLSAGPAVPSTWTRLSVLGTPPPYFQNALVAFDSQRDELILYRAAIEPASQTIWTLRLSPVPEWSQVVPSGSPPSRSAPTTVYDAANHRILMFGGRTPGSTSALGYKYDLWEASLGSNPQWTEIPTHGAPGGRDFATAAFDSPHRRLLLFGGEGPDPGGTIVNLTDAWALSLADTTWSPLTPTGTPPGLPFWGYSSVYDSTLDAMVIVWAGQIADSMRTDIWKLTIGSSPVWSVMYATGGGDFVRYASDITFDPAERRLLFNGGNRKQWFGFSGWYESRTDVWQFGLDSRTPLPVRGAGELPTPRFGSSLTYDPIGRRFFLVGGSDARFQSQGDTWIFDPDATRPWALVSTGSLPERSGHSAVYDSYRERLLVFGGGSGSTLRNDVWTLGTDPVSAWTRLSPSGTPPTSRSGHAAIYDPLRDRLIVFGGYDGSDQNDTWFLSLSGTPTWATIAGPSPPRMHDHGAVFDPTPGRMVVLSGGGVWSLSLRDTTLWTEDLPAGGPSVPTHAEYDSVEDRAIRFSASMYGSSLTYFNTLGEPPSGPVELPVSGGLPAARSFPAQGFEAIRRSLYVFGGVASAGTSSSETFQDLWRLDLEPAPDPSASLISSVADTARAEIVWRIQNAVASGARVDRQETGGPWRSVGYPGADPDGFLAFEDSSVARGAEYSYRVAIRAFEGEIMGDMARLTVPAPPPPAPSIWSLAGAVTNPSLDGLEILFSLPDAAPARLDLWDLRGRAIAGMEVGALGPGSHSVRLDPTGRVRAGVYLLRLTRGAAVLSKKVVVIGHS